MEHGWTKAGAVDEIKPGNVKQVYVEGEPVCVANVDGEMLAVDDICSHEYVMLSSGWLEDDEVECPQHGSRFSLRTGEVITPPATQPVAVFEVKVEGDEIFVRPSKSEE